MPLFNIHNISIYNSKISRPDITVSENRQTVMFELELPLENGGMSFIDNQSSPITTDMFICAKPGQTRHTKFPFKCCYIHLEVLDDDLRNRLCALPVFTKIKNHTEYKAFFDDLLLYSDPQPPSNTLMLQSIILKLLYTLCIENDPVTGRCSKKSDITVSKAIDFIEQNLSSDLKLETVSKAVSMSPIHFHNCFKSVTGKTLHNYIEDLRIKKSVILMQSTDMTLTEIAYTCGFSSQSYYSYAFKRKMQTTPRKYIQALNDNYKI